MARAIEEEEQGWLGRDDPDPARLNAPRRHGASYREQGFREDRRTDFRGIRGRIVRSGCKGVFDALVFERSRTRLSGQGDSRRL